MPAVKKNDIFHKYYLPRSRQEVSFMCKLREDVSCDSTALILHFKSSVLSSQLLLPSFDALLIPQGFLEVPYLHGNPSLFLCRMQNLIGSQHTGKFICFKNTHRLPPSPLRVLHRGRLPTFDMFQMNI